ncbi:MAG: helicase, partial [Cyanobium sp.]
MAVLADPADIRSEPAPRCTTLTTTWLPVAAVARVLPEPKNPPAQLHLGMALLADLAQSSGVIERLLPIVAAYRDWIAEQPRHPIEVAEQEATANHLARLAKECANRIEAGIRALADPLVREAFRTMNLVMDQAQRQRMAFSVPVRPEEFGNAPNTNAPSWRFFQLAFILMSLPGLAEPSTPEGLAQREIVELLFFPTGGGKTEAYLGLSAFTLVLRRLRHPGIAGAGLTVLMRYTLRLLTLDQLGRAATLICALELERQRRQAANDPHPLGDWPFEIGMWVGKGASPNKLGGPNDPDPR